MLTQQIMFRAAMTRPGVMQAENAHEPIRVRRHRPLTAPAKGQAFGRGKGSSTPFL